MIGQRIRPQERAPKWNFRFVPVVHVVEDKDYDNVVNQDNFSSKPITDHVFMFYVFINNRLRR